MRIPNWFRSESNGTRLHAAWNLHATGIVAHGFSARAGGRSRPPYDSLNLSLAVGDDARSVLANRRAFAGALGVDAERLVVANQTHSANVRRVTDADVGAGALDHRTSIADTDALITEVPGITLALSFADCACVFLLDPVNRAIGAVHAGWKGTALGIAREAVRAMAREFGSRPDQLLAAIGPCICRHCYDVGEDVANEITRAFGSDLRVLSPFAEGKWRLDLRTANLLLLKEAGLLECGIAISDECTSCNAGEFFSYRRDGDTGRMGGWIALRRGTQARYAPPISTS